MGHGPTSAKSWMLGLAAWLVVPCGEGFDWERDRIELENGDELRGVVIQRFAPDHVLLLREGNRRTKVPRAEIQRVVTLRDRLASFMRARRPGLSLDLEWSLVRDARAVGLERTARLQAYHVLLRDPGHERAHRFLGHERARDGWNWRLDGKLVPYATFVERSAEWNHRLVLDSEHFTLETDCGLERGLGVLFDLEGLYLWWMQHLGPDLDAAEDVDEPQEERMTFLVHRNADDPSFLKLTSEREPYYDPSGASNAANGGFNVARTYYAGEDERPLRLFELGTEVLLYSTLVLGRTIDETDFKLRRLSHWAEVGLGSWVAAHASGTPGYSELRAPFVEPFQLERATARASLAPIHSPHLLLKGRRELPNLVQLPFFELEGHEPNVPLARARCATFVSFLMEVNAPVRTSEAGTLRSRAVLERYLREVYCTQAANSNSAFDAGMEGGGVEMFEEAWKAWTLDFAR